MQVKIAHWQNDYHKWGIPIDNFAIDYIHFVNILSDLLYY